MTLIFGYLIGSLIVYGWAILWIYQNYNKRHLIMPYKENLWTKTMPYLLLIFRPSTLLAEITATFLGRHIWWK